MDTSFEILQPEKEITQDKVRFKLWALSKPDIIPEGIDEERTSAGSQQESVGTKQEVLEGTRGDISSGSKISSDTVSTVGNSQSRLEVKNKLHVSESSGINTAANPTTGNLGSYVAQDSRGTPQYQHPDPLAAEEKGEKSVPDETKYPKDKHICWNKDENVQKDAKAKILTSDQRSIKAKTDTNRVAPLADMEELSEADSMWFVQDDKKEKRKKLLNECNVNLTKSSKSSFEKGSPVCLQSSNTSFVTSSYQDNKGQVETRTGDHAKNLPKISVTKNITDSEDRGVEGSVFGITGEKQISDDEKKKLRAKFKGALEAEKKNIVMPVIRPTDPRRWAIAFKDNSGTPQYGQHVSSASINKAKETEYPVTGERLKDQRRWGIAPKTQGTPHEQYSQEFECTESDAECQDPPPDYRKIPLQLSATVVTTSPCQSALISTNSKPVLPKPFQPTRKTSPGIIFYDDRASALSSESLKSESSKYQLVGGAARQTDSVASQGAVGVSRFRRADKIDNLETDRNTEDIDTEPGFPYILYRRNKEGGQPIIITPPTTNDMEDGQPIQSYTRCDADTESILSEDIPRYIRKDQKQDMLASCIGSKSYPQLSVLPSHHASQDSLHSLSEVRVDHGKKGFMVYMVAKQTSPGPSEKGAEDDGLHSKYDLSGTTDDIEYHGPKRIISGSYNHLPEPTTTVDIVHYHSVPNMNTFGELIQDVGKPPSVRSTPEEDEESMPQITYKPAYGHYCDLAENTGHTFGVFGKMLSTQSSQKSPISQKSTRSPGVQRPKGPPPPVPPRKTTIKQKDIVTEMKSKLPQENEAKEGHMFGIFGQQKQQCSGAPASQSMHESLPSTSVKDIISKLDMFEERGREMDKTEAGPAVHGQERVEMSLLRQKIISQPGKPFSERQFVIGKASPMGARLMRPTLFPVKSQAEQFVISPENLLQRNIHLGTQQPRDVSGQQQGQYVQQQHKQPRCVEQKQLLYGELQQQQQSQYDKQQEHHQEQPNYVEQQQETLHVKQADLNKEERVFSVKEIIQKLNTGKPEVSTQEEANKYGECPYTEVARRYITHSENTEKPMINDDQGVQTEEGVPTEEKVPYYDPEGGMPQIEKISRFRELEMIYQNTSSIQDYEEESVFQSEMEETSITDDIKFMDDTDATSMDSDTDSGGGGGHKVWNSDHYLAQEESLKRLKPLGQKRLAQIHAIIDKKMGKKSEGDESFIDDISSYCLSKDKRKLLAKERTNLHSRHERIRRVQTSEPETVTETVVRVTKDDDEKDDSTPLESEETSDSESVDTQMDLSELTYDNRGKLVDENAAAKEIGNFDENTIELGTKETASSYNETKIGASGHEEYHNVEEEMEKQMTDDDKQKLIKDHEEREREELLRNEQRIRELEEKLARLEAPVREAVRKLLQVSGIPYRKK